MKTVLLLVPDLFFEARIRDAAARLGARTVSMAPGQDELASIRANQPSLILLTFNRTGDSWERLAAAARQAGVPVVAFGSHLDVNAFKRAKELGSAEVLANSRLTTVLPDLLARYISPTA